MNILNRKVTSCDRRSCDSPKKLKKLMRLMKS